jgi:hypothetical protein
MSHHFVVVRTDGGKLLSVDGNTIVQGGSGDDALGGQVAAHSDRGGASPAFFRLDGLA